MAFSEPIYVIRPDDVYCSGMSWIPYYTKEELREKGLI